MPVAQKDRAANEFRAKAEQLRSEIIDPAKNFTKDELEKRADEIKALEQRAAIVAGFTPERETEAQGGTEGTGLVRVEGPGAEGDEELDSKTVRARTDKLRTQIRKHFGGPAQYLRAVRAGSDLRLSANQLRVVEEARTLTRAIVGAAGDVSGGEFVLPLQQEQSIFKVDNTQPGILQGAAMYSVSGRTLRIPYLKQTDPTVSRPLAGIANVAIVGEATAATERQVTIAQRLLTVFKYGAWTELGDETSDDDMTGELQPTMLQSVGGQVLNAMNEHCTIDGTGVAMPLGALNGNNPSLKKIVRTTANKVTTDDVFAMYVAHTMGPKSYWQVSRRVVPELFKLTLGNNSLVTFLPNLTGKPVFTLLGLPVVVSDFNPTLGVEADVALVNPEFYAAAMRQQLTVESSIHAKFTQGLTTFRFFARGGGTPIPDGTYAYKANAGAKIDEHSPFVVLDEFA